MIRQVIHKLAKSSGFVIALVFASVVGSAITAIVLAAIPNGDGTVSTCYSNSTGALRVIDTGNGGTCKNSESSLTLGSGTGGTQSAFVELNADGSLNMIYTKGISASNYNLVNVGSGSYVACFDFSFMPLYGSSLNESTPGNNDIFLSSQVVGGQAALSQYCGSGYNAAVFNLSPDQYGFSGYTFAFFG